MSQMREDTYLPGCGILQELSGYVLCIYRIRESPERIISGINAFENHAIEDGETDDELLAKIQWAREKADWLDPFIAKKDNYLNSYDMDRILQAAVPERSYRNSGYSFWTKPYWKKKR